MGPLDGVKVLEMGVWVAGPAAGGILADWGADVVKIEPPGIGDPARLFATMLGSDLPFNPPFEMDNRSKRSIVIDLATPAGQELGLELVDDADVFVTNVRQAGLERIGFDPQSLLARNGQLVYCAITGFGLEGPDRDRAAYDIAAFWARSGIAHMLTQPGAHPPFQRGGMGDHNTGLAAAGAVAAALYSREKTGNGQLVSTSLLREGVYTLSFDLAASLRFGVGLAVADRKTMGNPCINNYQDKEGRWFWIVGLEGDRHWPPLARAAGHPEWLEDPRFVDAQARAANSEVLITALDEAFATRTRAEWSEVFAAEPDLWWSPVQDLEEVLADEQVHAAGALCEVPDQGATTLLPASPCDFHGTPWQPRWMAPEQGQHTDEVLGEMGRDAGTIAELRSKGVVA
ncbi:MAG: CoA transferase [Deltaproteobacteria bacterium]|jgi:crotonobetainyl-CoA:carnitine CoA-transferase CaiB-like acyl-CoA transferase|nr:CoA transferase [Deltaproteobacteria bacterium]